MRRRWMMVASALVVSTACGSSSSSSSTGPTNTGGRTLSAKVDGVAWSTNSVGGSVANGVVILAGSDGTQTIGISFAPTTGTQPISVSTVVSGSLTIGSQTWKAGPGTGTGTVTVTTATANHFVGTFSFTGQGVVSSVTPATRQVTAGTFDVTF
jgi:hypothetical protein